MEAERERHSESVYVNNEKLKNERRLRKKRRSKDSEKKGERFDSAVAADADEEKAQQSKAM